MGWSGIYRSVWLEAVPATRIGDVQVIPSIRPRMATVRVELAGKKNANRLTLQCDIAPWTRDKPSHESYEYSGKCLSFEKDGALPEFHVRMPDAKLWHVDTPHLYVARVRLRDGERQVDEARVRFGLREIRVEGLKILLNGTPVFLRGGCDDQLYVHTVCPPADREFHRRTIRMVKQYGFNYTKSCVEIYNREYVEATDEEGYLICQEMPLGIMGAAREARFRPNAARRRMNRMAVESIVRFNRNHPSVIVLSMASELDNRWLANPIAFRHYSAELPRIARTLDPRALVVDCTGESGIVLDNEPVALRQPHGIRDTDLQCAWLGWAMDFRPLLGPILPPHSVRKPFVFHEWCWITCLPDPELSVKLARKPLLARRISDMALHARKNGILAELPTMLEHSRLLKHMLRKNAFEQARREPSAAGYHHWLVQDFLYAAEGVFDEFWNAPRGLPADEFIQYNGDTVLCLEDGGKRWFENGNTIRLAASVSHFGPAPLHAPRLHWELRQENRTTVKGSVCASHVSCGELKKFPGWTIILPHDSQRRQYELHCRLVCEDRIVAQNHWPLWSFPAPDQAAWPSCITDDHEVRSALGRKVRWISGCEVPVPSDIWLTSRLSERVIDWLAHGGHVLFLASDTTRQEGDDLPRGKGDPLYRTVPYNLGEHGNMGTIIRKHPALDGFPHQGWCDFVFAPLLDGIYPLALGPFGRGKVKPIIRSIGHQYTMEDKAYLFEARVGQGRLMACAMRLRDTSNPAVGYLLNEMISYLGGNRLEKAARISADALAKARV